MIQSTDAFPLNFGFTGELEFLVALLGDLMAVYCFTKQKLHDSRVMVFDGRTSACKNNIQLLMW